MIETSITKLIKASFFELMKTVGTSIPGNIIAFNPVNQLAQVQIGVVRIDVKGKEFTPPPIIECPVQIPGSGDYTVEFEIKPGTECLLIFSQRCIDDWINSGGVAKQPIIRFHDMNDACAMLGIRSEPNAITNYSNNGLKLRNKDGSQYVWLKNDGSIEVISTGDINLNGVKISPSGVITLPNGVKLNSHVHSQPSDSGGNTEFETNGPVNI